MKSFKKRRVHRRSSLKRSAMSRQVLGSSYDLHKGAYMEVERNAPTGARTMDTVEAETRAANHQIAPVDAADVTINAANH